MATVKVAHEGFDRGWMRIDEDDFDPQHHARYEEGDTSRLKAEVGAHKGGGWYYVTVAGTRQVDDDDEPILVGPGKNKAKAQVDAMNEDTDG